MPYAIAAVAILIVILLYCFGHIGGGLSLWLAFNPAPPMYTQPPQPVIRIQTVAPVQAPALPDASPVVTAPANPAGSVTTLRIEVVQVAPAPMAASPAAPPATQGCPTDPCTNPEVTIRLR